MSLKNRVEKLEGVAVGDGCACQEKLRLVIQYVDGRDKRSEPSPPTDPCPCGRPWGVHTIEVVYPEERRPAA